MRFKVNGMIHRLVYGAISVSFLFCLIYVLAGWRTWESNRAGLWHWVILCYLWKHGYYHTTHVSMFGNLPNIQFSVTIRIHLCLGIHDAKFISILILLYRFFKYSVCICIVSVCLYRHGKFPVAAASCHTDRESRVFVTALSLLKSHFFRYVYSLLTLPSKI